MIWRSWNGAWPPAYGTLASHYGDVWAQKGKKVKAGCLFNMTAAQNAGSESSASSLRCLNNAMTTVDELAICRAVYLRLRWTD